MKKIKAAWALAPVDVAGATQCHTTPQINVAGATQCHNAARQRATPHQKSNQIKFMNVSIILLSSTMPSIDKTESVAIVSKTLTEGNTSLKRSVRH
jgi:hypothetical protein